MRAPGWLPLSALLLSGCSGVEFEWRSDGSSEEEWESRFSKATRREEHPLEIRSGETLSIEGRGAVEVREDAAKPPSLSAVLTASGRRKAEAESRLAEVKVRIERTADGLSIACETPSWSEREKGARYILGSKAELSLSVPAGLKLKVKNETGEISAKGAFAACAASTAFGDVSIEGARGEVEAETSSGAIVIASVKSPGPVRARTSFGKIDLSAVECTELTARSDSGAVSAKGVAARRIEIGSSFGPLRLEESAGNALVRGSSGSVRVRGLRGDLEASTDHGTVDVEGAFGKLSAKSASGDVRAAASELPAEGPDWTLSTSFGKVSLTLPASASCRIDATTSFGEVESAFPLTVPAGKAASGGLHGSIGPGGRLIRLSTASGDIEIQKGK